MSRWFRMYTEVLNDPKVQLLQAETFKSWINILCLCAENEGRVPPAEDVAFALRETLDGAETVLERLLNAGLIDRCSGGTDGAHYAPHGWRKRQYKSDTSTVRVKRFRERSKTDAVTPPETETETEVPLAKANGAAPDPDKVFWDSAKGYLGAKNAGMIGKWCKDHGRTETARAITDCMLQRPPNPIEYIHGIFRKQAINGYGPGHSGVPL